MEIEDGFLFYLDIVLGELFLEKFLEVYDFWGGLFCDEFGLGKIVIVLFFILKI